MADQVAGGKWQVNKVSVKFNMAKGNPAPMSGTVAAELPDELCPGKFSGDVKMTSAASEATLSVAQFPLAMLRPLAARLVPGTNVAGRLSTEARVTWGGQTAEKNGLTASVNLVGFAFATPSLQPDVLQLDRLLVGCQASWQADCFRIDKSTLDCDFGNATLVGAVPLGGKDGLTLNVLCASVAGV